MTRLGQLPVVEGNVKVVPVGVVCIEAVLVLGIVVVGTVNEADAVILGETG